MLQHIQPNIYNCSNNKQAQPHKHNTQAWWVCTHTYTHTHTQTCPHARMHTHTHKHTHAHTHNANKHIHLHAKKVSWRERESEILILRYTFKIYAKSNKRNKTKYQINSSALEQFCLLHSDLWNKSIFITVKCVKTEWVVSKEKDTMSCHRKHRS